MSRNIIHSNYYFNYRSKIKIKFISKFFNKRKDVFKGETTLLKIPIKVTKVLKKVLQIPIEVSFSTRQSWRKQ